MNAVNSISPILKPVEGKMEPCDDELIRRHQSGDDSAFNALISRHERKVLSIAARFTHCPEDTKDIYQEVVCRVYKGLDLFRFRSAFSTWLYRIAINVCIMHRAVRRKNTLLFLDSGGDDNLHRFIDRSNTTAIDILRRNEISRRIVSALETLSPKQRMVFVLKHYEGHKIREIAEFMHCTEGTIKKYLFTAIDRLRDQLQDII
jgi:RNA polymerase sigma-70 factor (ECF subfamily)